MAQPDPNSIYAITDSGGRPIQCQNSQGINVYTADSLNNDKNQDWNISSPAITLLSCTLDDGTTLYLGATSFSEGADVQTYLLGLDPINCFWQCNDDGSIELLDEGAPTGYLLNSLMPGFTNQLKVSKNAPKQTWTWNKKSQKGGGTTP